MAKASTLIDLAERLVPPDQIKSAGYDGALVYVSELRPGANFDFKPVNREYADALRAAGLHVVSCYQYGKPGWPTPSDYTRGYDGGVADAQTALRLRLGQLLRHGRHQEFLKYGRTSGVQLGLYDITQYAAAFGAKGTFGAKGI